MTSCRFPAFLRLHLADENRRGSASIILSTEHNDINYGRRATHHNCDCGTAGSLNTTLGCSVPQVCKSYQFPITLLPTVLLDDYK